MGLEAVEIVIKVEETFGVAIEDSDAQKMMTPGDIIKFVMEKAGRTDQAQCQTQRAFHRVRASIMRLGSKRESIKPNIPLSDLVPRQERKAFLRQMLEDLGVKTFPKMVRPKWLVILLTGISIAAGLSAAVGLQVKPASASRDNLNFLAGLPWLTAGIVAVAVGWIGALSTRVSI